MSFYENLHSSSQTQDKMKSTLLLDVVIRECTSILQLLTSKDQSLLIWRNSFLVLNLSFDVFNRVGWFHLKSDRLASQRFHEDLHTSSETKDKMKCTFLLDVVVRKESTLHLVLRLRDEGQDEVYFPFGCCSQKGCDHLQAVFPRRSIFAGQEEFLPYLEFWL